MDVKPWVGCQVSEPKWTYMLRILGRNPNQMTMDRLAAYMAQFSQLLGVENKPVFAGIKNASTGLRAKIPARKRQAVWTRIQQAKYMEGSRPAGYLRKIEEMLTDDRLGSAELQDNAGNVVYLFKATVLDELPAVAIKQHGVVDGVVTGLIGADDTMHLHVRDVLHRDLRFLVKDEQLARDLLSCFRRGWVRLTVYGLWVRTEDGWVPEANRCTVSGFDPLDDSPLVDVFDKVCKVEGNGWQELLDPMAEWRDLRGIH